MSASQQVAEASSVLGLLLAIVALFTATLSSTLQSERTREGGPHRGVWRRIMGLALALAAVSVASLAALVSTVRVVIGAHGTSGWEPAFWVFLLVYLLLVPLCIWQFGIALGAFRLRPRHV
jgi:cation transporter-like permease